MAYRLTEQDGRQSLHDHVVEKAAAARRKYGESLDYDAMLRLLADREVVRYPVAIRFDAEPLQPGEFAYAQPLGDRPSDGFCLCFHPCFQDRVDVLPLLMAYHLVRVNYGEIATYEEAELFGATLLGLDVDVYYETLCALVDSIPAGGT